MKKKISLIISGGVSLGAYEAGAITEILYALEHLNAQDPDNPYIIDVITGASAGSIMTALTAKIILHNYNISRRILYESWVKEADIKHLMKNHSGNSVLSNQFLYDLISKYLGEKTPSSPAKCAPEKMLCGFSLTNQVGVDYGLPIKNLRGETAEQGFFSSTFFSDFARYSIKKEKVDDPLFWKELGNAAVASGSFPLAFPPAFLKRKPEDYPYALASSLNFLPGAMGFVDGGMFNNEPLKQAILLSREQDHNLMSDDRIFILIDPSLDSSMQDLKFVKSQSFGTNALRLIDLFMSESQARDWLKMGSINKKIHWKDHFIEALPSLIQDLKPKDLEAQIQVFTVLVQKILNKKKYLVSEDHQKRYYLEHALRIKQYYKRLYTTLESADQSALFEKMVFAFENISNLDTKFPLEFYVISSDRARIAGNPFFSFGGFFKESWREHDFRLGRQDAYRLLPEILKTNTYPKEEANKYPDYNPLYDMDPSWGELHAETIADTPKKSRRLFASLIESKLKAFLKDEPLKLSGIKLFIATKATKSLIKSSLKLPKAKWYNPISWFK